MTSTRPTFSKVLTALISTLTLVASLQFSTVSASADTPVTLFGGELFKDLSSTQWGIEAVRARDAWSISKGRGVTVAVIDTGVDGTHPDLVGRVLDGYSTVLKKPLLGTESSDEHSHGTHVASIIAADDDNDGVVGVAPEATILPVQALGAGGGGNDRTVADAIDFAVANGAKVINLSLGGEVNPFENGGSISCAAVERAFAADVVVVVAAGNAGGYGNPLNEPASCKGALSVAAIDEALARTSFSSYDSTVRISAPGRRVVAAVPNIGEFPYAQWNGTSMAAPFVAGVAALLRAAEPNLNASQVVERILSTATDIASPGTDSETGAGLVDAAAALGATSRTALEARAALAAFNVPTVVRATTDGTTTTLSWEAPTGSKVSGYRVAYHGPDGDILLPVSDGTLTATIDASTFPFGWVSVTALTPNGDRLSFPLLSATYTPIYENSKPKIKVTQASARWVKEGIEVSFKTSGPKGTVDITVTAGDDRLLYNQSIPSDVKTHLVKVASNDVARSSYAFVLVYVPGGKSKNIEVSPQYQISAVPLTGGSNYRAISGATTVACFSKKLACQGSIVQIREVKTGKVIGTTRVLENLKYSATFKWSGSSPVQVRAEIGKLRSPIVTLKPTVTPTSQKSDTKDTTTIQNTKENGARS
jgi:hypothetical protein